MCDFLSFIIRRKEGEGLSILATVDLKSHSDIERVYQLTDEMKNCYEAEWVGNAPHHLTIRFPDDMNAASQEKVRSWVLGQYKNRNALLSYLLTTLDFSEADLDLAGLTSAEGLTLPQSVGGGLDLAGLTSAEGLTLPQSVGGWLDLKREVRQQYEKLQKQKKQEAQSA